MGVLNEDYLLNEEIVYKVLKERLEDFEPFSSHAALWLKSQTE